MNADRVVRVSPERLPGWVERFATRHGEVVVGSGSRDGHADRRRRRGRDRATVPFPPLPDSPDPLRGAARPRRSGPAGRRAAGPPRRVRRGRVRRVASCGRPRWATATSRAGPRPAAGRSSASPGGGRTRPTGRTRRPPRRRTRCSARSRPTWRRWWAAVTAAGSRPCWTTRGSPRCGPRLTGRVLPTPDPRLDVLRRFGDTAARGGDHPQRAGVTKACTQCSDGEVARQRHAGSSPLVTAELLGLRHASGAPFEPGCRGVRDRRR